MAISKQVTETPEATMARVKSELAAAGTPTGATAQLNVEREAGLESKLAPTAKLPTGRAPTAAETAPSKTPVTAAGAFVEQVRQKTQEKIAAKREELLSAPSNYDTQVALQRGALYEALAEEATALTPEKLRWLTPDQQAAIRSGDKGLIKNSIIGLNSILQFRSDARKEEEAKAEKADAKRMAQAETTFNLYSENGLWASLDSVARAAMETTLGLPTGTIDSLAANQNTDTNEYNYSSGLGNSIVETVTDRKTGKLVSTRTIGSTGTGGGDGSLSSSGFTYTTPETPAVEKESWEEYLARKEEEAGQSFSQPVRDQLRAEYDLLGSDAEEGGFSQQDYGDQFESVVINLGSVSSQDNARKHFQDLLDRGETGAIESYLNKIALDGLTGKALTDYNAMGTVAAGTINALTNFDTFKATDPSVYKSALESAKPFAKASRDQDWVSFVAQVEAFQAGYRNTLFGAALTDTENAKANGFLIDFQKDDAETALTKLNGMRDLSNEVRERLLKEQRGVFGDYSAPVRTSLDAFVSPITDFISP